jgi:hypothetical protein
MMERRQLANSVPQLILAHVHNAGKSYQLAPAGPRPQKSRLVNAVDVVVNVSGGCDGAIPELPMYDHHRKTGSERGTSETVS